jgi:predicted dehydrogenase
MLAHFNGVSQGDVINYAFDKPEPLRVEHENFRDRVLGKGGQCVTLEEGLKTLSTADAVLLSASKNQVINL